MARTLSIAYLLESTCLCGGVKVVLRQAETLLKRGHRAVVFSPEPSPAWFTGDIAFEQLRFADTESFHPFDAVIGTTPGLMFFLWRDPFLRPRLWHLVQGYEGCYAETAPYRTLIHEAYALTVPKITVSASLADRLRERYPAGSFYVIGQGLESQFFFPPPKRQRENMEKPDAVFLIGPLAISIKQIRTGLQAFHHAARDRSGLQLVRITTTDTRKEEEALVGPIGNYHVHLTPKEVGHVLRTNKGVFLSPSDAGEGFGLPALEAMACGVPTVLTDIPSYRHFDRPRDYSLFVPCNDPAAMAGALRRVIERDAERDRLIRRGLEVAARYSYDRVAAALEGVLNHAPKR